MSATRTLLVAREERTGGVASVLEQADCTVTTVESATAALAELSTGAYDCVVSEYELPGDDGLSLLRAVRETDPELPFVLFTDATDGSIASEALLTGANRYVPRNGADSLDRLRESVTEVVGENSPAPAGRDVSGHEPASEEIVRAIDDAPIGITLSDPSLPDDPIVYLNDAWEELTGYDREEILGRNPRLLQGPETDPETVDRIRTAIEDEEATTVEIRNYRSDGTPFWNELTVAPVYDEDDSLTHLVGFQSDVTERKTAERIAEQREERLAEQRAALEHVLARVNGLLNDVARVLVTETDRAVIEDRVCEEIAAATGYAGCWLGRTNPPETRLRLAANAGLPDDAGGRLRLEATPEAVADAIENDEPRCCDAGDGSPTDLGPASIGARRLLVVPLTYGRKRYGLLGVYAAGADALDGRERRLFDAIGKMIASGLNAVETTRILTTDRVTELRFVVADEAFPLSAIADRLDAAVEYVGMTANGDEDGYDLYLNAADPVPDSPTVLTELPFVEAVRAVAETDSEVTVAVTVDSATPFADLAEYGATVEAATAESDRTTLRLVAPPEHDVRPLLDALDSRYDRVDLRSQRERDRREPTRHEFAAQVDADLTERQHTALETAYLNGYFEWPRPVDGRELAETMGISRQTFHQHLRAAERKLVDSYFDLA